MLTTVLRSGGWSPHIAHKIETPCHSGPIAVDHYTYTDSVDTNILDFCIGSTYTIQWTGNKYCTACLKKVAKLFQGFCWTCCQTKAIADLCMVSPHKCHYALGTCREPQWAQTHCFQPHYIYLAFTNDFKIGITRQSRLQTRWLEQGALCAMPLALLNTRQEVGLTEHALHAFFKGSSHWLKMLNQTVQPSQDTIQKTYELVQKHWDALSVSTEKKSIILPVLNKNLDIMQSAWTASYPVQHDKPVAWKSIDLEKTPTIEFTVHGMKANYVLTTANQCFNFNKFAGFQVHISKTPTE
jgi:Protein of unknown function (DUF2797)